MSTFTAEGLVHEHTPDCSHSLEDPLPALRGRILIRTPDDSAPNWTAQADLVPGVPYIYSSGDVSVVIEWDENDVPQIGSVGDAIEFVLDAHREALRKLS